MTLLEAKKLQMFRDRFGPLSSDQALQLAIDTEQICQDCGPFDMAYTGLKMQQLAMEEYAALLEKEERAKP